MGVYARMDVVASDEVIYEGGERIVADYRATLQSDEDLEKDDQVTWQSQRFEVVAIQPDLVSDAASHKVAYLRRLIES